MCIGVFACLRWKRMLLATTERFAVLAVHISDGYKRRLRDFGVAGVGSVEFSTQTKDSFETATLKLMLLDDHSSNVGLILRGSAAQRTMERAPLIRARAGTRAVRPASSIRTTENAVQRSSSGSTAGSGGSVIGPHCVLLHPSAAGRARLEHSVASEQRQREVKFGHASCPLRSSGWRAENAALSPEASQHRERCAAPSCQHLRVSCRRKME